MIASFKNFSNQFLLIFIDSIGLFISINLSFILYSGINPQYAYSNLFHYYYLILMFPFIQYALSNYQIVLLDKIEEFKKYCFSIMFVHFGFIVVSFLLKDDNSRLLILFSWQISFLVTYNFRTIMRKYLSKFSWWGSDAFILGAGTTGRNIFNMIKNNPSMGLNVKLFFDRKSEKIKEIENIDVINGIENADAFIKKFNVRYGILAIPTLSKEKTLELLDMYADSFVHFILIPDLYGVSSLWVTNKNIGGYLGLEINHKLIMRRNKILKRFIDLFFTIIGGIIILPLLFFIAVLIFITSKGPIMFSHERIGKNGKKFKAFKFRTMKENSSELLEKYLALNPQFKNEWETTQKLKKDPRITFVGKILRKLSFDEFPQLYNVLKGEMSLVGPRPIVDNEIEKYDKAFSLYKKVIPGMTGLWQISGRNNTTYDERVNLDTYYVRNWSMMLDIYILWKTISVVLLRKGAY